MRMRRWLAFFLCLSLVAIPVGAEEPVKYAALTFDEGNCSYFTQKLLDGLQEREAKATFFLSGERLASQPELARRILDGKHEIGIHSDHHAPVDKRSRRQIAADLAAARSLLPEGCRVKWYRSAGKVSDGLWQVAQVKNLAFLGWSAAGAQSDPVRDGDVVRLRCGCASEVAGALGLVERLQADGFRLVTVSELSRIRGYTPRSGNTYHAFPRKKLRVMDDRTVFCPKGESAVPNRS